MSRIFDITLKCGCMLSADGGGALIPCTYDESCINPDTDPIQLALHQSSWKEFEDSGDKAKFDEDVERLNH